MNKVAPPVKLCDIIMSVQEDNNEPLEDNNEFSLHSYYVNQLNSLKIIDITFCPQKMLKKQISIQHIYNGILNNNIIHSSRMELILSKTNPMIRLYLNKLTYSRNIIEELYRCVVKSPHLTPRKTKDKNYRGVIGARRVKVDKIVYENGLLKQKEFIQIEVYGNFKLVDVFAIEGVDSKLTSCNDVYEIQSTFGTDAAKNFVFNEIFRTVNASSNNVNPRFVAQIVDYMVWTGRVEPITRHGMKLFGPMKSAAFEQPTKVLTSAALGCKTDFMLSPTSNVILGQELRGIGTAILDAIPIEMNNNNNYDTNPNHNNFDDELAFAKPFYYEDLTSKNRFDPNLINQVFTFENNTSSSTNKKTEEEVHYYEDSNESDDDSDDNVMAFDF